MSRPRLRMVLKAGKLINKVGHINGMVIVKTIVRKNDMKG